MLHRLIHKPPVPLEPVPLDKAIFSKKGKIRISALTICKEMGIDPQDIYPKSLEDFAEKDVPANVQILRFNGYETQRRSKYSSTHFLIVKSSSSGYKRKNNQANRE